MRALPDDIETSAIVDLLVAQWGFAAESVEYAAVGGGSYHWLVRDPAGARGFVTVDDLDRKPWFGPDRKSAYEGLRHAFDTAARLRGDGLPFVVAPRATLGGDTVVRLDERYSAALFPFVDGSPGEFGKYTAAEHTGILGLLAELHRATPSVSSVVRTIDLSVPGRPELESALGALDEEWPGGPFSEPARAALARNAPYVAALLALADRLEARVASSAGAWVVTHGEPHAGNVLATASGFVLVDWDTVALAPPERDLWMLVHWDTAERGVASYTEATRRPLDDAAVSFFRLTWDLADIAAFTNLLRGPHTENADTAATYDNLVWYLTSRDRWEPELA